MRKGQRVSMSETIDVEVVIGGKQYTISGAESSEYIQRIAMHINDKLGEFKLQEAYAGLDPDMKNILLAINLSDDYFKAKQQIEELKIENDEKEEELFDMKHELIKMQSEMDKLTKETKELKTQQNEDEHSVIRMEAKYEQASKSEEKSRLQLTRLEKNLKMIQESEQRAQAKNKELDQELKEQKELVQTLKKQNESLEKEKATILGEDNSLSDSGKESAFTTSSKTDKDSGADQKQNSSEQGGGAEEVAREVAASLSKAQTKKSSRGSRAKRR